MYRREKYRELQEQVKEERKRLYFDNWNKLMRNLNIEYNNPKRFQADIRKYSGSNNSGTPYILNNNNEKIFEKEEKEKIFRGVWEKIFQITHEENKKFDQNHERQIKQFFDQNQARTKPYAIANLNRDNYLTKPIKIYEITAVINKFKNKAPGESRVNKLILSKFQMLH